MLIGGKRQHDLFAQAGAASEVQKSSRFAARRIHSCNCRERELPEMNGLRKLGETGNMADVDYPR